jgi:mevalonate kinase
VPDPETSSRGSRRTSPFEGFGRGKVILLGEHGVVYGRPALACGIERGAVATATESDLPTLTVTTWDVSVPADPASTEALGRAFDALLGVYATRPSLSVTAEVALPAGAGLGCSAALGVAVLAAMDAALGVHREPDARAEASLAWERVFHGTPSGVDSAMASAGGVAIFRRGEPLTRIIPKHPLTLVVANSGEPSSTKSMVDSVRRQRERNPERIDELFDAIASLVRNGHLAIEAGDVHALGQLMDMNHGLLSSLLLSTTGLETLVRAAREAGAEGAKVTGAGGGGCMIALCADDERAECVRAALAAHADEVFVTRVGTAKGGA